MGKDAMEPGFAASEIDTSRPHPARMYDALPGRQGQLPGRPGGRPAGRCATSPRSARSRVANRAFMQRAVRFLAAEAGIRQFIDIGTGIPSAGNVHEVAGQAAPEARVVYVDNDPIVHVHANALLTGSGTTSIVLADLRDPEAILARPRGPRPDRLHPAGRAAAGGDPALHHRRRGSGRDRGHAARRAAGRQLPGACRTRRRLPPAGGRHARPSPRTTTPPPRRAASRRAGRRRSSTAGTWSSRAWSRYRCGARTAGRPGRGTWRRSASTPASAARPCQRRSPPLLEQRAALAAYPQAVGLATACGAQRRP